MSIFNIKHWEYWPSYCFYLPNIPYAIYLAIKAKNPVFFSATNPAIKNSGNGTESKFKTLDLFPSNYIPKSIFVEKGENLNQIVLKIKNENIQYPLIIKPDIGFRGLLVKQLHNRNDLESYLKENHFLNLIIQEFIDYKNECGIFYHKIPGAKTGKITSITLKKYLTVIGNGYSTLEELIDNNKRALKYKELLHKIQSKNLSLVLEKGEEKILNVIGNHSKGTQFINGNNLISKKLEQTFDKLFLNIDNVFYGRVDLKYTSFENLTENGEFKIIEMNGIISEPTHIYDPSKGSYFDALKAIRTHWKLMYDIAVLNHRENNINYEKISIFINDLIDLKKYTSIIKKHNLTP